MPCALVQRRDANLQTPLGTGHAFWNGMSEAARALEPEIEVACVVCGRGAGEEVCSAEQLAAQLAAARRFHGARSRARSRAALEERASFTHDYATRLLACRSCGLLYRSPRPPAEAVLGAYEREEYSAERLPQMIASQHALYRPKARSLVRCLGRGARVLEVGSFVGGFLWAAREAGLEALGLDPSQQLSAICRRSGLRVTRATLEEFALAAGAERFDAVAIWNTFDQLARPRAALSAAARLLRPGGLVLIRVPHGDGYRRLLTSTPLPLRTLAWNNLLGFPYLHGYGLRSLDRLLREFHFGRVAVRGDVLGAVCDASYAPWAWLEESAVKARRCALLQVDLTHAPWLDVSYQQAA